MRATDIGIRSPREFTPAACTPSITYDGRSLFNSLNGKLQCFRRAERFSQYYQEAKKTGFRVGPGSYDVDSLDIGRFRGLKTPLYKSIHGAYKGKVSSYYMVGNSMVSYDHRRLSATQSPPRATCSSPISQLARKRIFNRRRTLGPSYSPRARSPLDKIRTRNNNFRSKSRKR